LLTFLRKSLDWRFDPCNDASGAGKTELCVVASSKIKCVVTRAKSSKPVRAGTHVRQEKLVRGRHVNDPQFLLAIAHHDPLVVEALGISYASQVKPFGSADTGSSIHATSPGFSIANALTTSLLHTSPLRSGPDDSALL